MPVKQIYCALIDRVEMSTEMRYSTIHERGKIGTEPRVRETGGIDPLTNLLREDSQGIGFLRLARRFG